MNRAIPCAPSSTSRPSKWPVTPEVAGSSPVAPVSRSACKHGCLPRFESDRSLLTPAVVDGDSWAARAMVGFQAAEGRQTLAAVRRTARRERRPN